MSTSLAPSEHEDALDQQLAREIRDPRLSNVVASLVSDQVLIGNVQAMRQSLRLLEAKLRHVTDPRDPFPKSGLEDGHQRASCQLACTPSALAKLALEPGGAKGFRKTKACVLTLLARALQLQLQADTGLATLSVRFIVTGYGRRTYDVVRRCLIPVKTGRRGAGAAGCAKYNAFAALVFMYRVILAQDDEQLRRKLLRRTAFYLPFAHEALLEIATEPSPSNLGQVTDHQRQESATDTADG